MSDLFPGFHNAYNCRLDFELSVSFDCFVGFALFLGSFLELDLVDLEAEERRCKLVVYRECVGRMNIFPFGGFRQDTDFATC